MGKGIVVLYIFFLLCLLPKAYAANDVVINEMLVNPSSTKEWIEIYNPLHLDISKYWIDDDTSFIEDIGATKKSLSGVTVDIYTLIETSSVFNNTGDYVVLFDQSGNIVDEYEYIDDPGPDVSLGRSPNGIGEFSLLVSLTKGSANSDARPIPTATSQPTPTPSKIPTPTKEPTLKKLSPTMSSSSATTETQKGNQVSRQTKRVRISGIPTSVLTASTTAKKQITSAPTPRVLVNAANDTKGSSVAVIVGALLFVACGILIFVKQRSNN